MNTLDVLGYVGFLVVAVFTLTGFYVWARWGVCGVSYIWQRRSEVDQIVAEELKNLAKWQEHGQ